MSLNQEKEAEQVKFTNKLKDKDEEIEGLGYNISELEDKVAEKEEDIENIKKKIPKKPEEEYIEEVEQKNVKIEELMDELLQRDTLIDQQAVLNKEKQKKCDQQAEDIK
eukprot:CAMPEP_0170551944 /NCGR_PEP_ID=MMETSP0211-20121228/9931_1 /TAXON_ID=311385 /ORGANISM="Pseudokeronopsis sp., Strain OXSARD2" /LENGTH=108 /DNA_ID=CAMNT_0010859423 /DNA_START=389 /DNA_END=715 /DNA_ORIENTATION=+